MEIYNNGLPTQYDGSYQKIESFDDATTNRLAELYKETLSLLGEDVEREGLLKTPLRVAKSMQFLTQGYNCDPKEILRSAMFKEEYQQMEAEVDAKIAEAVEFALNSPKPEGEDAMTLYHTPLF